MKMFAIAVACFLFLSTPFLACAETQLRGPSGVVIEIRQSFRDMSYAFDGNRNPLYIATSIPGNLDVVEYRDNRGVYMGIGGVGTIQWAQEPPLQFGSSGQLADR